MNFLYIEMVLEIVTASILWVTSGKAVTVKLCQFTPREELEDI